MEGRTVTHVFLGGGGYAPSQDQDVDLLAARPALNSKPL